MGVEKIEKKKIYLIFTTFYLYFIIALFESSRGNFIPFFMDEFQINNSVVSNVIAINSIGSVIGYFLAGYLCDRFGHKLVFILGCLISTVAIFTAPFIGNVAMLAVFYFTFGLGRSFLSLCIDSIVPVLSVGYEVILMNVTHLMYGLGSFTGQRLYGTLLTQGFMWRHIYLYIGFVYLVALILILFIKPPSMRTINDESKIQKKTIYKNWLIYIFILAMAFENLGEALLSTWFVNYIRDAYSFNPADAAFYSSMFFMFFTFGRLAGGFIVFKLGNAKGLNIFMSCAAIIIVIGLLLKQSGLMIIALSGFFISVAFPTIVVLISSKYKANSSFAIGIVMTFSNIIYIFMIKLIGVCNDLLGTYNTFFIAPISIIICVILISIAENQKVNLIQ